MSIEISLKFDQEAIKRCRKKANLVEIRTFTHVLDYLYYLKNLSNDYEGLSLHISGFGENPWPLEDSTELIIFLEQLPSVLLDAQKRHPFKIEFYEQGFERELNFTPRPDGYRIDCIDSYRPNTISGTEELSFLDTVQTLEACLSAFELFLIQFFDAPEEQYVITHWYKTGELCWSA